MTSDRRVAFVTGAARGIGAACAVGLAATHAVVVLADLAFDELGPTTDAVRAAGAVAVPVVVDVQVEEQVVAAVAAAGEHGTLRSAVNCAGVGGPSLPLGDYPLADWRTVIDVDLTGAFLCMREELTLMVAAGAGSIVNISSVLGQGAGEYAPAYTAAKHGLEGLTKSAALAYATNGIRVNAVAPGFIDTELLRTRRTTEEREVIAGWHPVGRLGSAEEVAAVVTFLASDAASFVTGSCYRVDGGFLTRN